MQSEAVICHLKNCIFVLTFLFIQDLERYNKLVCHTLHHPHFGLCLAVQRPQVEGHGAELLVDLGEELAGVLHLQHVGLVRLLVDGDFGIFLAAVAFTGRDEDVDGKHLMHFKVKLFVFFSLGLRRVLDDGLLAVNDILV